MAINLAQRQYVGVVLVTEDGSVLAQHRDNIPTILGPNTWAVIGGRVEKDDASLLAAASRELLEETDYAVDEDNLRVLVVDTYTTEKGDEVERNIYWARYDGSQPIHRHEGQEIRFVSPSEFNKLKFYTGHEGFFRKASEKIRTRPAERKG